MTDDFPNLLPGFEFRQAEDPSDEQLLDDVREYGWHVVLIQEDETGPAYGFTVGLHARTLQPEIVMMGLPLDLTHELLNDIAAWMMDGEVIVPGRRYSEFIEGREVVFQPIDPSQYHDHLGYANWFYRDLGSPFPALQCLWPDSEDRFPQDAGFDPRLIARQPDLSKPVA
ncbi:DUF4262 domain-containing protein [Luteolibacter flavescens]|uniref:DUF4262 domain-containing protein n=1 Tax=Luteolibacter flavescens TaxID=1859460 RepID=A0ABT3FN18_9BACT|nr:DUF4262 domain-containing protein [Luteolibacter flavescens]MCW1884964.1 DUF4262 domain-containing protein [Luteolibacter flavescens]